MSEYTISMSYNDFKRMQDKIQEFKEFREKIVKCIDYEIPDQPVMIKMKELKSIALSLLPFPVKEDEVIDV